MNPTSSTTIGLRYLIKNQEKIIAESAAAIPVPIGRMQKPAYQCTR
jgi:hypothetical protein